MKTDPICGMEVSESEAITYEENGKTFYFCSEGCRDRFLKPKAERESKRYDLIIIGAGPAGLTAAVYAAKLKMDTFVISSDLGGQAIDSTKIENYMGFDFITGPELIAKFREQLLHSNYVDHAIGTVEKIEKENGRFQVTTHSLATYESTALIFASGMTRRRLNVLGEEQFQRRGVFYGNVQDLSFVEDKSVAVIGGGNSALQIVERLQHVAREIYIISDLPLSADPKIVERIESYAEIQRYEGFTVDSIHGTDLVKAIRIRELAGTRLVNIPAQGVFICVGLRPNTSLLAPLLKLNERSEVPIAADCSTEISGLFAAGDVTDAYGKRIIIACGEGAKAALAARDYLLSIRKEEEVSA